MVMFLNVSLVADGIDKLSRDSFLCQQLIYGVSSQFASSQVHLNRHRQVVRTKTFSALSTASHLVLSPIATE